VWWAWTQFTWALNAANTDHPRIELATLTATAMAFFMAVSVPGAFGDGAWWFAVTYVAVRTLGLLVYWWVAADAAHRTAVRVFALSSVGGLVAVLTGAAVGGTIQYWLWGAAIALDVIAAGLGGREEGWNLHPEHFAERHGLIVIIALGESLIVAAAGLTSAPADGMLVVVAVLAVSLTCALWWSYFPYLKSDLEHGMAGVSGAAQSTMARDAFSLAHFPLLCGIISAAAAIEEILLHPDVPLPIEGRLALGGGLFLFLVGSGAAHWRASGKVPTGRLVAGASVGTAIVTLASVPPWISIGMGIVGVVSLILLEQAQRSSRKPAGVPA
jgi:low temperature requirement protein LtrA